MLLVLSRWPGQAVLLGNVTIFFNKDDSHQHVKQKFLKTLHGRVPLVPACAFFSPPARLKFGPTLLAAAP